MPADLASYTKIFTEVVAAFQALTQNYFQQSRKVLDKLKLSPEIEAEVLSAASAIWAERGEKSWWMVYTSNCRIGSCKS